MDREVPALGDDDPRQLGPYRLLRVLGAGGMGKVYLGRDRSDRPVAVKVLLPELAQEESAARRFQREAWAARAVRSRGVGRVLDSGSETDGQVWMATEFLAGPTLGEAVVRYGAFDEASVRRLGADLAATLRDIHRANLVHRDLKPANIVMTSGGPRVIDFGIARPEYGLTLTVAGRIPATPGYAAPEQVLGRRTGPAGDVFSLGVVLAFAASARPVFTGEEVAAIQYNVVYGEPDLTAVPQALRPVLEPCLSKDADRRPGLPELIRELAPPRRAARPWLTGPLAADIAARTEEVRQSGAGRWEPHVMSLSRRRFTTLAAGGAVAAGATAWWLTRGDGAGAGGPTGPPWQAEPLGEGATGSPPDPYWTLPEAADTASPAPVPVHDVVAVAAPGGGLAAYRVQGAGEQAWTEPGADPAGGLLVVEDAEREGGPLLLATDGEGALIALAGATGERAWTAEAGAQTLLAVDGTALYCLSGSGQLRAVELATREVRWTVPLASAAPGDWDPENLTAVAGDGMLLVSGVSGVSALATGTGRAVWSRPDAVSGAVPVPAVHGGTAYLAGSALTAVALADGSEQWSHAARGEQSWGSVTVTDDRLFAGHGTELTCRRREDGGELWVLAIGFHGPEPQAPTVQHDSVWAVWDPTDGAGVTAARLSDGMNAWSLARPGAGEWRMSGADNRVFLLHDGTLMAMPVL
ncbi:protein kinase domain-containing protein [Streptomyces xiamenensis]